MLRTPTDIFPAINIPVVSIIWTYTGLTAKDIEQRLVYTHERSITTHRQQYSTHRIHLLRRHRGHQGFLFQPGSSPEAGVAQLAAVSQTILKKTTSPGHNAAADHSVCNASTVPILQYGISSPTLSEQQILDLAMNTIRVGLISVPGASVPYPYGGKVRVISVDLDVKSLEAQGISQQMVVAALSSQNLVYPSGTAKIGANEYPIDLNTSPAVIERLNDLPVKSVGGTVIRVRDVAQVHDGFLPQENVVRQDGVRSTLMSILKSGTASTLDVASGEKAAMATVMKTVQGWQL